MPTIQGFTTKGKTGNEIMEELSPLVDQVVVKIKAQNATAKTPSIKTTVKDNVNDTITVEV